MRSISRDGVRAHVGRLRGGAALLAEVDAAGELAHEHEIDAVEHLGLDRRRVAQRGMQLDGSQVGVDTELAPDAQQVPAPDARARRAPTSDRRSRLAGRRPPRDRRRASASAMGRRSDRSRRRRTARRPTKIRDRTSCATRSSTRMPSATTSGPMPSPAMTAIFAFTRIDFIGAPSRTRRSRRSARAGSRARRRRSAGSTSRSLRAGRAPTVPSGSVSVVLAMSMSSSAPGLREQPRVRLLVDEQRQQAVLQAVRAEDVRELGADDGIEAVVLQRPRRVLARRAAAEVATGDEDARARGLRAGSARSRASDCRRRRSASRRRDVLPKPAFDVAVRNRAGMIWSVSMLVTGSTTVRARMVLTAGMCD